MKMGDITVLISGQSAAAAVKELDNSSGTAETCISTSSSSHYERIYRRPPIVISEDDDVVDQVIGQDGTKTGLALNLKLKDSLEVLQKCNDTEEHEENANLEDILIPHHSVHIDRPDEGEADKAAGEESATNNTPTHGILHKDTVDKKEKPAKRSVQFSTIEVRDYDMILGDHPCCSYGPPITIDWDYLEYEPIDVNEYELHHPPRRALREMSMNYYTRKRMLANAGYRDEDFKLSKREMSKTKINRSITRQLVEYKMIPVESAIESTKRKVKRLFKGKDHWKLDRKQGVSYPPPPKLAKAPSIKRLAVNE